MDYDYDQLSEAFHYLDGLRASGATNMFGAAPYVQRDLGHDKQTASKLVSMWMKSFDDKSTVEERVKSFENQV